MNFNDFDKVQKKCPFDLRWYIGKFIKVDENQMAYLTSQSFLEYNLKILPQSTLIKLFVNAIYNKFKKHPQRKMNFGTGRRAPAKKMNTTSQINDPIEQFITINLDTIYYGFTNSSSWNITDDTPKPQYKFNIKYSRDCTHYLMQYVPTDNHSSLTTHIDIEDFARLIRRFSQIGTKSTICEGTPSNNYPMKKILCTWRYKILYEFTIILQLLGNKYRRIQYQEQLINKQLKYGIQQAKIVKAAAKEQAKIERAAAKEQAKIERIAAKEQAKNTKVAAKEQAKIVKAAAKEQAKIERVAAKEQAIIERVAAKEQAIIERAAAKEQAKIERAAAKEQAKIERAAAKEQAKRELQIMKREDRASRKYVK